ncbi:MAG: carbohydrate kinase [Treponema sp.]|nr:carbohydrate kinase [Treponema sp.]
MIICCGEALIDMIRTQIPGSGDVFTPVPGGSPYNTAIAISKLGVAVKFLGCFSTDYFGEILVKRLRASRVGDELIVRSEQNSPLAFVKQLKAKEPEYTFYMENCAGPGLKQEHLPESLPAETSCILFGSISMAAEPIATTIETLILREGSRKGADKMDNAPVISFDPNIRPFMIKDKDAYIERLNKMIAASTIIKMSIRDYEYIYPDLDPEKALAKILTMGPRLAICTLGPKGAMALLRKNDGNITKVNVPGIKVQVMDTIGAGDAFHGAFLCRLHIKKKMSRSALVNLSEKELYDAILYANKAAAVVCSRLGAEMPNRREVDATKLPAIKTRQ